MNKTVTYNHPNGKIRIFYVHNIAQIFTATARKPNRDGNSDILVIQLVSGKQYEFYYSDETSANRDAERIRESSQSSIDMNVNIY